MGKRRGGIDPEYLTVSEVADELHVSRATALTLIDGGELPAIDVSPTASFKMRRVARDDVERFKVRRGITNGD